LLVGFGGTHTQCCMDCSKNSARG